MMQFFGKTDIGLVRDENQDSFFCGCNEEKEFLGIICDGIGGGLAGDVASRIGVSVIKEAFLKKEKSQNDAMAKAWIKEVVDKANTAVYEDSLTSRKKNGMGTTLVGVLLCENNTYVFHLGDSRVYALYDELICLTEDHNLAADLIKSGELSEEEAFAHPKGKALTNALGVWSKYIVEINKIKSGYTQLLLCSDGLHGYVQEAYIEEVLRKELVLEEKVNMLIEASTNSGGFDNVSVIVVEKGEN